MIRSAAAVLFDLDGTLVDTEPAHRAAWQAFFSARGHVIDEEVYRREVVGRRGVDVFRVLPGPWRGEDPDALVREVLAHLPTVDIDPTPVGGAVELLEALRRRAIPVAVVTSAVRSWADRILTEVLLVEHLVDLVVAADDVAEGKPSPLGYARAAQELGVPPGDAVAIEDSPSGVQAARAAAVGTVIGVLTSTTEEALREAGAHRVVPDLRVLVRPGRADQPAEPHP